MWDASRKCIHILSQLSESKGVPGWRKKTDWAQKLKGLMRTCGQINRGGGKNKENRLVVAVTNYLEKAYELEAKVNQSIKLLYKTDLSPLDLVKMLRVEYFHEMLIKHIDLIERRLLKNEKIPHEEKVFSLFEPFTEWVNKGKLKPSIELGRKLLLTTDQHHLILDYKIMDQKVDSAETMELVDRLFSIYGDDQFDSLSFDKGFSKQEDREILELFIPNLIMQKRGRLSREDKERETTKKFKKLRNKHCAIESNINCLEHHGLNRCPDKGFKGFKRYVGFGILSYNLHKIGNHLLAKKNPKAKAA